ncbi:MAG: putative DNA-binding domain-containing protein [Chroococcidiopsidaceae cyanobacterium CP_BM_RX_35]|nr:putative DNA-binding domain-containing protein [Chroococcidiopsidaceae cyanobacterium CP_BM_RX_35]
MLQQLQQTFLSSLATGDSEFLSHLQNLTALSAQQTLNIYHQGVKAKALNVLKGIYQVCQQILGTELFDAIAADYFRYSPPQTSDFIPFAAAFVKFITEYCLEADCSYLAEIARLEWEIYLLLREFDSPVLDLEALAQVDTDSQSEIFFHLPTGAVLLQSNHPLDEIMKVNQPDNEGNSLVDLTSGEFYFIVWRAGWSICIDRLTLEEWLILQRIQMNIRFGELCNYLAINHPHVDIATTFPRLVAQGWITNFTVTNN